MFRTVQLDQPFHMHACMRWMDHALIQGLHCRNRDEWIEWKATASANTCTKHAATGRPPELHYHVDATAMQAAALTFGSTQLRPNQTAYRCIHTRVRVTAFSPCRPRAAPPAAPPRVP